MRLAALLIAEGFAPVRFEFGPLGARLVGSLARRCFTAFVWTRLGRTVFGRTLALRSVALIPWALKARRGPLAAVSWAGASGVSGALRSML